MPSVLEHARSYLASGLSVIPVRGDGSKEPDLPSGHDVLNRRRRATDEELTEWFASGFRGVAILGGPVSGNLEVIDLDRRDLFDPWAVLVNAEAPGLLAHLTIHKTPRGWHIIYRCPAGVQGNQKLASELDPKAPPDKPRPHTLAETRGDGGYILAPGCPPACHELSRTYDYYSGPTLADGPPTLTVEQRSLLLDCARALNTWVAPERSRLAAGPSIPRLPGDSLRPGDDFNDRADWQDVIGVEGWVYVRSTGSLLCWRRPGKERGISATTGLRSECGSDLLHVFTSNGWPFEPGTNYSKFAAFALLRHEGDFSAAAKALQAAGWGEQSRPAGNLRLPQPGEIPDPAANEKLKAVIGKQMQTIELYRHDELLDADLPPLRWIVDGLVPDEGLTLIGGKKKLGKSWLCLQIAQAVASGGDCLGKPVSQGRVVYVCLEDGKRRLKARLIKQHARRGLDVVYVTRFPKIDDGSGMTRLMELIEEEKPRLLLLDTLAAAKTGKVEENAAGPMGDLGNTLRAIAQHYHMGIAATHHHGKLTGGDPGDDLRGSSALAAAADVNLGMYRGEGGYRLKGEGRDIDALDLTLVFDAKGTWVWMVGEAPRVVANQTSRSEADQEILSVLKDIGEGDAGMVADRVGKSRQKVKERLDRLTILGVVAVQALTLPNGGTTTLFRLMNGTCGD